MKIGKFKIPMQSVYTLIALFASMLILCVTVFAYVTNSTNASVGNINLEASTAQIEIAQNGITIIRTTKDGANVKESYFYYKKDIDGKYYEVNKLGEWITGITFAKKPFNIKGLLPNETVDFIIPVSRVGEAIDLNYSLAINDIRGSVFKDLTNTTEYSILGVYRVNLLDDNRKELDKNGALIHQSDGSLRPGYNVLTDSYWLDIYTDNVAPLTDLYLFNNKVWSKNNKDLTIRFRLTLDTTQISKMQLTNVLSEKEFSIGSIFIYAEPTK
ncbi:MAG: hypothetical protein RR248_02055 [Clostridia bacterium]